MNTLRDGDVNDNELMVSVWEKVYACYFYWIEMSVPADGGFVYLKIKTIWWKCV